MSLVRSPPGDDKTGGGDADAMVGSPPLDGSEFAAGLAADCDDDDLQNDPTMMPEFERAHWDALRPNIPSPRAAKKSMLRSASAMTARERLPREAPISHSSSRPSSARPLGFDAHRDIGRAAAMFQMPPPPAAAVVNGFTGGGVIISASGLGSSSQLYGGTPRRAKSDPVAMHAVRMREWRSDSFLSVASNKPRIVSVASPTPAGTVAAPRRRPNDYVVPTSKRRDDLVWQTRLRMRQADADAGGRNLSRPRSKQMLPNKFVPCTEKRRDDLRWAQRAQMAWVH